MKSNQWINLSCLPLLFCLLYLDAAAQAGLPGRGLEPRSESEAFRLAITNTIIPIGVGYGINQLSGNGTLQTLGAALTVYGIVVGPSTGNFYAQDYARGGVGAITRGASLFLVEDGARELFGHRFANSLNADNERVSFSDPKILIGSILIAGTAIYNVAISGRSARDKNRELGFGVESRRIPGNEVRPFLTLHYRF